MKKPKAKAGKLAKARAAPVHKFMSGCRDCMAELQRFNDDMILRSGLPKDVMELIHDLAYHVERRDVWYYVYRAQKILKAKL